MSKCTKKCANMQNIKYANIKMSVFMCKVTCTDINMPDVRKPHGGEEVLTRNQTYKTNQVRYP